MYAEKELFDVSEQKGIFHVSRDGWTIDANTSIYMYYDKDHADNSTYIGTIGARTEIWDGNFLMVCHMVDDTTSTLKDSTSNSYDLIKKGANEPLEENGKEQHFDGTNDYITQATLLDTVPANGAISVYVSPDVSSDDNVRLFAKINDESPIDLIDCFWRAGSNITAEKYNNSGEIELNYSDAWSAGVYYLVTATWGSDGFKFYMNDTLKDSNVDTNVWANGTARDFIIGANNWLGSIGSCFDGIYREMRVSQTQRNATWAKAEYNSLFDSLLTYGSEETEEVEVNAIFFGTNQ